MRRNFWDGDLAYQHFSLITKDFEDFFRAENQRLIGYAYLGIGNLQNNRGWLSSMETMEGFEVFWNRLRHIHFKALNIFRSIEDSRGLAHTLNGYGNLLQKRDYKNCLKALDYHEAAQRYFEKLKDKEGLAHTFYYLGTVRLNLAKFKGQIEKNIKNNTDTLITSQLEIARDFLMRSQNNYEELGLKRRKGYVLEKLSRLEFEHQKLEQSKSWANDAKKIFEEIGDKRGIAYCYLRLAKYYDFKKLINDKEQYANKALQLFGHFDEQKAFNLLKSNSEPYFACDLKGYEEAQRLISG